MLIKDADALIAELKKLGWLQGDTAVIEDIINEQPTIEAVPVVHGEVVTKVGDWGVMHQECSVCGEGLEWKSYPNFCPNCGADMRKKV